MKHVLFTIAFLICLGLQAQECQNTSPNLFMDLNPNGSSSPSNFYEFNNRLYFSAIHEQGGRELWVVNSSGAGNFIDINPTGSSNPRNFISFNGNLYFTANDGIHGIELWVTNGTDAGTQMIMDIEPNGGSNPAHLTVFNNRLYFSAHQGFSGRELWVMDADENVQLFCEFNSAESGNPHELTVYNNHLYFAYDDGSFGVELWRTDGEWSSMFRDFNLNGNGFPTNLTLHDGFLYLTANDGLAGNELWKINGSNDQVSFIRDINVGSGASNPKHLISFNNQLLFRAFDGTHHGLWSSGGFSFNTNLIIEMDVNPSYQPLHQLGDEIIFNGSENGDVELWISDGTIEGTRLLFDIEDNEEEYPTLFCVFNERMYFITEDNTENGVELWSTDGTNEGTCKIVHMADAFSPLSTGFYPIGYNDQLFFSAAYEANDRELYTLDTNNETAIFNVDQLNLSATIFPNPTSGNTQVEFILEKNTSFSLSLINVNGSVVRVFENDLFLSKGKHNQTLHLDEIPTGIYFIKMETSQGIYTEKLFIK